MRRNRTSLAALAILFLAVAVAPLAFADDHGKTPKPVVFTGSYDWSDGGSDFLEATFEPDGDGAWDVTFRFKWNGNDYTWKGTARGSLEDGSELTGTGGANGRKWDWQATVADGVMNGRHTEKQGDRDYDTGTFEMRR